MSTDTLEHVEVQGDRGRIHIIKTYGRSDGHMAARMFCGLVALDKDTTYLTVANTNCAGCLDSFTDPGPIQPRGFTQS